MNTIVLVVLILLLVGALPTWPYSANWGYYPSGGLGLLLLILLIMALTGRRSRAYGWRSEDMRVGASYGEHPAHTRR